MDASIIFLGVAALIIALAMIASRIFRSSKSNDDLNGDPRDGDSAAIWNGIDQAKD